jgi:hypothetical protein
VVITYSSSDRPIDVQAVSGQVGNWPYLRDMATIELEPRPWIYFACAISAGRQEAATYYELAQLLSSYGTVLTEAFADLEYEEDDLPPRTINERDLDLLVQADLLVAEITVPSLGVGYEISKAESWKKPVLCLYRSSALGPSPMILGGPGVASWAYRRPREASPAMACFVTVALGFGPRGRPRKSFSSLASTLPLGQTEIGVCGAAPCVP